MLLRQISPEDFEIATASNVAEAIEYCNAQEVHLVLTDITMPQQSGLDLLQILRETHPKINTAVLSAYNDYQYIRSAMQLGAIDYILKSEMQLSDILSVLRKVNLFSDCSDSSLLPRGTLPQNNEYSLIDFLDDTSSLLTFLANTAPALTMNEVTVYTFTLEDSQPLFRSQILNICNRTLLSEGLTGCTYYAQKAFWLIYNTGHAVLEHQKETQQKISLLLERNLRTLISKNIQNEAMDSASSADDLRDILNQHLTSLCCHQYYSSPRTNPTRFTPLSRKAVRPVIEKIRVLLEQHHYSDAADTLIQFVQDAHHNQIFPAELKGAIYHCITILFLNSSTLKDNTIFASKVQIINRKLHLADTAESVEKLVSAVCILYKEELNCLKMMQIPPPLKKAIAYIEENYMHRLTLNDLANNIYLNKNYISQMFKDALGISFSNYLEGVRIYKAQELLRNTDVSVTIVAEKTGYHSQSYFTKAFKKRTGLSPLKYRNISQADSPLR